MEKIVIIGSAGAGKSTLAQKLGSILNIKVFHLDRIFWQRGWKEKPRDLRIDILQKIIQEKQWIIEGTYLGSSEPRLNAADTIIFLDTDPLLCLQRIIKRYLKYHGHTRRDIPEGCTDKLTVFRMFKVLTFPFQDRRTLLKKIHKFKFDETKEIIWLRSPKEVDDFLAKLEPHADEKSHFSKMTSVAKLRQLAATRR